MILFSHLNAQSDSTIDLNVKTPTVFSGTASLTNNGISIVPAFTLGKPAIMFDLAARKKRFSFEPILNFEMKKFRPWSFIFWLRYKLIQSEKFNLRIGTHPSFPFFNQEATTTIPNPDMKAGRAYAGELAPSYQLNKSNAIGLYYLHGRGQTVSLPKQIQLIGLNFFAGNIQLTDKLYMKGIPMIYYLDIDNKAGTYFTYTVTLAHKKSPLSISSVGNKVIKTNIPGDNFSWNIMGNWTF
jgi:hypothetical protein